MADPIAPPTHGIWKEARIVQIIPRTATIASYFLAVTADFRHTAGQHVVVRLTAPDGYSAQRSYSIASPPSDDGIIEIVIERLADGEVSTFFHEVAAVGDDIELRGPIGGHFIWTPADPGASLLIAGGSGVVPMMAMVRQHLREHGAYSLGLLLSARTVADAPFYDELAAADDSSPLFSFSATLTREPPTRPKDRRGRIAPDTVKSLIATLETMPERAFICGSNRFVNAATESVLSAGVPASTVRTERYGG